MPLSIKIYTAFVYTQKHLFPLLTAPAKRLLDCHATFTGVMIPFVLPSCVTVAQRTLNPPVQVRILARQPLPRWWMMKPPNPLIPFPGGEGETILHEGLRPSNSPVPCLRWPIASLPCHNRHTGVGTLHRYLPTPPPLTSPAPTIRLNGTKLVLDHVGRCSRPFEGSAA